MRRRQLEHIVRAASGITGESEFVIIDSRAVLGQFPDAPAELLESMEADVFSLRNPAATDLIDGSIGEGSPFHETFGYYAHGVGPETATLPSGWRDRLIRVASPDTGGGVGLCLEVHDLSVSKLVAGRDKDLAFVARLVENRLVDPSILRQRLVVTPLPADMRAICEDRLQRIIRTP